MNKNLILRINNNPAVKYLLLFITILLLLYLSLRYSWRMFGFKYCSNTESVYITNIILKNGEVKVAGGTSSSALCYDGYTYSINDDKLYLGLKYSLLFGNDGGFDVSIKTDTAEVKQIFLKSGKNQKEIWNKNANPAVKNSDGTINSKTGKIDLGPEDKLGDEYIKSITDAEQRLPKIHLLYGGKEIKWMIGDVNYTGIAGGSIGNTSFGWRFRDVYLSEGTKVKAGGEVKFKADDVNGLDKARISVFLHTDAKESKTYKNGIESIKLPEKPGTYIFEFISDWGKGDNNIAYWSKIIVE